MIDNRKHMSCAEFSACMAELIAAGEDIFAHPHVRRCKLHRALLDDLEAIAKAARQIFPEVDPPDTLWDRIQEELAQKQPGPMVSDPWPGYRVVVAIHVIEYYNSNASPPVPHQPPVRLRVLDANPAPSRREGRRR
jgi:hypothetical protein